MYVCVLYIACSVFAGFGYLAVVRVVVGVVVDGSGRGEVMRLLVVVVVEEEMLTIVDDYVL